MPDRPNPPDEPSRPDQHSPNDSSVDSFFDVVLRQRACRSFAPDPVPDDLIAKLLEAATHAPSAENRQPWVFLVVRRDNLRETIGSIYLRAWDSGAREHSSGRLDERLLTEVDEGARGGVASAPVLIVVCGDSEKSHPQALASSIFPAVQNLLLAAGAVGLGSALTTLAVIDRGGVSRLLELPDHIVPMALVPVGWPSRTLGPPRREPVETKTHREVFGNPW
jgi:nitroreductase